MSLGYSAEQVPVLLLLSLGLIVGVPLVLWGLSLLLGLLGVQGSPRVGAGLMALLGIGLWGLVAALEAQGTPIPAQVVGKTERVKIRESGDWERTFAVGFRYRADGSPLPPFPDDPAEAEAEAMQLDSGLSLTTIRLDPPRFDALAVGETVTLRVVRVGALFQVVWLASLALWAALPLWPLALVVLALLTLYALWRLRRRPVGWALAGLVVAVLLLRPPLNSYREWQRREALSAATHTATAMVTQVTRITEIEPFDGSGSGRGDTGPTAVWQHYDIVQFSFVPDGATEAIIGVDSIDVATESLPAVAEGREIEVRYPPDNPRDARLPDGSRRHIWLNTVAIYSDYALAILVALAFIVGSAIFNGWRWRRERPA